MIIPTHESVQKTRQQASLIKDQVSKLLGQRSNYPEIISLLAKDDAASLSLSDQDIYILRIISETVSLEMENNTGYLLFDNRSIEELITLYKTLSLYLRRIEFDLPDDLKAEVLDYILKEKISVIAVVSVIQNNMSIVDKDKVTDGIMNLLESIL